MPAVQKLIYCFGLRFSIIENQHAVCIRNRYFKLVGIIVSEVGFVFTIPDVFNTDQGTQFTSQEFIGVLTTHNISISMDGRGRCLDNIFVERLWRSVKYENVYLKSYQTIPEARAGLREYFEFYNMERFHQSLDNKTPWQVYCQGSIEGLKGLPSITEAVYLN